jgi:indolepyruvate ferredoxin oxidoreductase
VLLLGVAFQRGLLPLELDALSQAIRLNGAAVQGNLQAFALGRLAVADPVAFAKLAVPSTAPSHSQGSATLAELIDQRAAFLIAYQNQAYADRYRALVDRAQQAEAALGDSRAFTETVARTFFRLMAYKDEYEVARLYRDPAFGRQLANTFEGKAKLTFHLAPPSLLPFNRSAAPRKRRFGAWMLPAFGLLAALRGLRGTRFDPFGYSAERKAERAWIERYAALITTLSARLQADSLIRFTKIAALPQAIRGYGHIKEKSMLQVEKEFASLLPDFDGALFSQRWMDAL